MSVIMLLEKKIEKELNKYDDLDIPNKEAIRDGIGFMFYSLEQLFKDADFEEIEEGIVDSAYRKEEHDYGIDAVYLTANGEMIDSIKELDDFNEDSHFTFHLIQFKKGTGADQATFLKLKEGIKEVFINNNCNETKNTYMFNRMSDINELRDTIYEKYSTDQITVQISFVFGGIAASIEGNDLLLKQIDSIRSLLKTNGYCNVKFQIMDASKLLELERKGDEIIDIIQYVKSFQYITESENNRKVKGYISVVNGEEIAKLVQKWQNALFEANIRDYYKNSDLNLKILDTCSDELEAKHFWSFNNGLTIICNKVEELPGNKYRLTGCQVVNGCQTSNALYLALKNKERLEKLQSKTDLTTQEKNELNILEKSSLHGDTHVFVKVIETKDLELIYRITETTNSQTPIKTFSLKANDDIQKLIEDYFKENDIFYERRVNFYKNQNKRNIVSIEKLFQLYISQIFIKPSQVKTAPKKMFETHYEQVFPSPSATKRNFLLYLIPVLVDLKISKVIRQIQRNKTETDSFKAKLMSYGKLHLGCLVLHSILDKKYTEKDIVDNSKKIKDCLDDESEFLVHFHKALTNLKTITQNYAGKRKEIIPTTVRKAELDTKIHKFILKKK